MAVAEARGGGGRGPAPPTTQTQRAWKGLNLTDSRLTLDDDELYRCENAMPLGRGIAPTPLYNGPAGVSIHPASADTTGFGRSWVLEAAARDNVTFPAASVFVDDFTVYAFHRYDGTVINPLQYDISTDGGKTFPTRKATAFNPTNDVLSVRLVVLGNGTQRFVILQNDSKAIAYSDNVITLPTTSTWTEIIPPTSVGAPIGVEFSGLNGVVGLQDGGTNLKLAYTTDGGTTWLTPNTIPADTVTTPFSYQIFASPSAGIWVLLNPKNGKIYRSTDSGNNWGAAIKTMTAGDATLPAVGAIFAPTATRVVAVWKGQVSVSDDAGATWTDKQNLTLVANSPVDVKQGGIGWISSFGTLGGVQVLGGATNYLDAFNSVTTRGATWRSTDNGTTWTIVNVVGGGLVTTNVTTAITAFAARNGRGVIDVWNVGTTERKSWYNAIQSVGGISLIKESFGCSLTYGTNTIPHPVGIYVFEDGSAFQRDFYLDGAVDTQIAAVGTFSASPLGTSITIWQDGPVLIQDDKAGYAKWDGVTYTVLDSSKTGHSVSVFSGYVFLLVAPRTISFTAPNTFSDFSAINGAGTFKITDDAFAGAVQRLISTVSQLWIVGVSALDALGNIATASGITTFSVTNAVSTLGTAFGDSVNGYFRSIIFSTGYSIHSLLGVTPQKLSGKIDRLFASLGPAITFGPRWGVVKLYGQELLVYLFNFTDPQTSVQSTRLLCFAEGKWFVATTPDLGGNRVLDIVTLTIRTAPEIYGIDAGGFIYRIFARPGDAMKGTVTVGGKLSDGGNPTVGQQAFRVGFDFSAPATTGLTALTLILATEATTTVYQPFNQPFLAAADAWLGLRYAMYRSDAKLIGQRLGWTLSYPCADQVTLEAAHLEAGPTGEAGWDTVSGSASPFVFTQDGPASNVYVFLNT